MPDILATTWTTSGDSVPLPGRHLSPLTLAERIEAASANGFAGYGLLDVDLVEFLRESDLATLRVMLDDSGMRWREIEFLSGWWKGGPVRDESDRARRFLFDAAESLGADHVKIGPDLDDMTPPDVDRWAEELHSLGAEAAEHGLCVALEFLPCSNVPDLAAGLDLVRRADHAAAGLCLDLWHVQRAGTAVTDIAEVPVALIKAVELEDAMAEPIGSLYDDTVLRRRYLGDGEFPVTEFIQAVHATGWRGPWGIEIIAEAHRVRPIAESLPDVMQTTRAAFARAGIA